MLVLRFDLPTLRPDLAGLAPTAVGTGLAALFLFPGFQYGTGDRDPGVYVETGVAIAIASMLLSSSRSSKQRVRPRETSSS